MLRACARRLTRKELRDMEPHDVALSLEPHDVAVAVAEDRPRYLLVGDHGPADARQQ